MVHFPLIQHFNNTISIHKGISMLWIKSIISAALHSQSTASIPSLARRVLQGPWLFGMVSTVLQLRDSGAQGRIMENYTSDNPHFQRVQSYNAFVTQSKSVVKTRRAQRYFRIIGLPDRDVSREKILLVGPRNVHELLMAWIFGFSWGNITGIDLYSTNPKIKVMNMENMSFPDDEFDVVVMANTLAYASDTEKCLSEVVRVLKPGGVAAFGATFTKDSEWIGNMVSGADIAFILSRLPVEVYYYRSSDKVNALGQLQTVHDFGIVKKDPVGVCFDHIDILRNKATV
ncbi:MAG: class I SAM-dependent methyltransferase [Leptolyngbyaceae bacterium]|nr:class I SAM-dependent methyltransferase [Leptolyngbyaceae bacterium]